MFEQNLIKFKRSNKRSYDFFTRAGKGFQNIVFKFCEKMFEQEDFPKDFDKTILHMIYKGSGRPELLGNNRFIHCKSWFPRVVEGLVVEGGLRSPLLDKSSMFQVGGQPGHRTEELVFTMKSIIARRRQQGEQ